MYCVIDIGSNTIRLVVYRVENNTIKPMLNKKYSVGLAGYINKKQTLNKKGILKTISVLKEYRLIIDMLPDCEVFPFATASLRNIVNSAEVLNAIKEETGFSVRILSGHEEALFSYNGAMQTLPTDNGIVADIGGGSTEIVLIADKSPLCAESVPIGSLNLYESYINILLPTKKELSKIETAVKKQIKNLSLPKNIITNQPLCAVGGTARAALEIYKYINNISDNITGYDCGFFDELLNMYSDSHSKMIDIILKTSPDRIHTILPGIVILKTVSEYFKCSAVTTSPFGVREGYLCHILKERGVIHD